MLNGGKGKHFLRNTKIFRYFFQFSQFLSLRNGKKKAIFLAFSFDFS